MAEKAEITYVERLDISTLSVGGLKNLIKTDIKNSLIAIERNIDIERNTWHIIGPAGVGKTQICFQIAKELTEEVGQKCEVVMIKAPVLSRDDMIIPFPSKDGTTFDMLYSHYIPTDPDSFGIFVIDEASRGDHAFQQLMWQVQNEQRIHLKKFPKKWFIVATDNPDDQEYSMDTLEDAAGLRRMIHIYTEVSVQDFLTYAQANDFHPMIIDYITSNPDKLYDWESQKMGKVYANPASFEKLSNHMKKYDLAGGYEKNLADIDVIACGLINMHHTRNFMEFLRDLKTINPKTIFYDYSKVRKIIQDYMKAGENAKMSDIITAFQTYITSAMPKYEKENIDNMTTFLTDIPIDTAAIFVTSIDKMPRRTPEYIYFARLHKVLFESSEKYRNEFYEKLAMVANDDTIA